VILLTPEEAAAKLRVCKKTEFNMSKTYACSTWPSLSIGRSVRFRDGFFETNDPETQRLIERAHGFGIQIQEVNDGGCKTEIKMKVIQELGPGPINETDMKLICPLGSLR